MSGKANIIRKYQKQKSDIYICRQEAIEAQVFIMRLI